MLCYVMLCYVMPDLLVGVLKGRQNALFGAGRRGGKVYQDRFSAIRGNHPMQNHRLFWVAISNTRRILRYAGAARPSGASSHTLTAALCSRMR